MPDNKINCVISDVRHHDGDFGPFVVIKLTAQGISDELGETRGRVYYALRQSTTLVKGKSIELDLSNFRKEVREWESPEGELMNLTYLLPA